MARGRFREAAAAVTAALALLGAGTSPALAGEEIDRAAAALRADPVFVAPEAAEALRAGDPDLIRDRLRRADTPIYVAILPGAALDEVPGRDPDRLLLELRSAVGRRGTYAMVVWGRRRPFRAGSDVVNAGALAAQAFQAHGDEGVLPTLLDLIDRVDRAAPPGRPAPGLVRAGPPAGEEGGAGWVPWALAGAAAAAVGGAVLARWRRRRRQEEEVAEQLRRTAAEDLWALGEDLRMIDADARKPGVDDDIVEDYGRALDEYERAARALDRARAPGDFREVSAALERGRYAFAAARARLEGEEPPERRPPCFFDPRHGPSTADMEWAPPGGAPRAVPACPFCAQQLSEGREPRSRQVVVGGREVPMWNAPGWYAPWYGGYFGLAASGLLAGLALGEALSGGFGGAYWGGPESLADTGEGFEESLGGSEFGGGFDAGGGEAGG